MKGEDGSLTTYNEESKGVDCDSDAEEKENKKKIKKKTAKPKIESEETLEMLKQVLRPKKTKNNKDIANDVQIIDEERSDDGSKTKTAKTKTVSKVVKKTTSTQPKAKPLDTMTRFITNFGDTPHLQAIEDSYLKYLEA